MRWRFSRLKAPELRGEAAYAIYRHCMYMPTRSGYEARLDALLRGPVYGARAGGRLVGIIALTAPVGGAAEIAGIAVAEDARAQGLGRWMIARAARAEGLARLTAETDDEAVGFYRRCGFSVRRIERDYGEGPVVRWLCETASVPGKA